jgi:hypothetical protein
MLGVILFSLILLFYGFILSGEVVIKAFPQSKGIFDKVDNTMEKGATKLFLSLVGLIAGIWNLFAPDFTAMYSPPVIGALIPSLLLIVNSTIIYPNIIEILNVPEEGKGKYYAFLEKYKGIAGIVTIFAGLLHLVLYKQILF